MNNDFFCVLFFLSVMFLLIFCCTFAEVYEDPDMCFSLTQDGWIKDLANAYEIKASDADLYGFDAFSALTFAAELGKVDFDKKQRLGFDMKFQNYTLTNFEMEVKRANE